MSKATALFNVLSPPPQEPSHRRLPWPAIAATVLFIFVIGQDANAQRQRLVSLRYALMEQEFSAPHPTPSATTPDDAAQAAIAAELTYPWDSVLNFLGIENNALRLLSFEASSAGSPAHLRISALQTTAFWSWLALVKKNPAVATATAVTVQSQDSDYVFEVAITWRRP
ncbi:MAG: hypothetical protein ACOY41_12895 [Pseudomonadota bacterium]